MHPSPKTKIRPLNVIPNRLPKPKAVLFDLDGTLVESSLNFSFLRQHFALKKGEDILKHLSALPEERQIEAEAMIQAQELKDAWGSQSLPGARELLDALKAQHIPTAIITRNSREAAKIKIRNNDLPIDILISREDCQPKPHPEGLLTLARQWNINPADCWYIGDYLYDLQAANNAGMVAGLYTASHPDKSRYADFAPLADVLIDDFDNLRCAWQLDQQYA